MSHSRVFDEYAAILSKKDMVKTAADKEKDYNVTIPSAGSDTKVDDTGYSLTEIAHPEQVQVANSLLNDGIVENGVEVQKVMTDVARRNPRGVLAELMQALVKIANALEADMTPTSFKLAKEVDDFLVSLAQQSQVVLGPEAALQAELHRLPRFIEAAKEALNRFGDLDWSVLGFGDSESRYGEKIVNNAIKKLQMFDEKPNVSAAKELSQYVNQFYKMIQNAISKSKDWGSDQKEALVAWDNLKAEGDEWIPQGILPHSTNVSERSSVHAPEQQSSGVASKTPPMSVNTKHTYLTDPQVGELQELLGNVKVDDKFGPKTFAAVMEAAQSNYNLQEYLHGASTYAKSYTAWDLPAVEHAILAIKQFNQTKAPQQNSSSKTPKNDGVLDPYTQDYEAGWNASGGQKAYDRLDKNKFVDKNTGHIYNINNPVS